MKIDVKLFGPQARLVGLAAATLDVAEPPTCAALRAALAQKYPQLGEGLAACRFAVNHAFVADDQTLAGDDEVALIGQVSGG